MASTPWTPQNIASSETLLNVKLSPDGNQVLYEVKSQYKPDEHATSALWIADTRHADSARQLTSGMFNDRSGVFHPDGQRIIFLSDRHKAGGPAQIYCLNINGGESYQLLGKDKKRGVSQFTVSPDGQYLAFASPDEPTEEDEKREKDRDDARVFGDTKNHDRLRLYCLTAGITSTLNTPKDKHIHKLTWKADSTEIAFCTLGQNSVEFTGFPVTLSTIPISCRDDPDLRPKLIGTYHRSPLFPILWTADGDFVDTQTYEPHRVSDSLALFTHSPTSFSTPRRLYGEVEDSETLVDVQHDGLIAVAVTHGVDTRVDIVQRGRMIFTLYDTDKEALHGWDVKRLKDGEWVFVAIRSSALRQEAPNIWVGRVTGGSGERLALDLKLSSHLKWLDTPAPVTTYILQWKAEDGTELDGIVTAPQTTTTRPLPTILCVHGGPYWRDVPRYNPSFTGWNAMLASHGYLVISPNYRGGQGHGSTFARAAHNGMGKLDWSDCSSMLNEVINLHLADPFRVGIAGWGQGGFMTAWGVTKTKNRFKAGVMGAGISDWGMMVAAGEMPESEVDLGGTAPWTPGPRKDLEGSPIRYVEGVETPVLILHGEKDENVTVSQGIAFMRGLRRYGKYPERSQLVVYPREGHGFTERKHAEDVLKRVLEHFQKWL